MKKGNLAVSAFTKGKLEQDAKKRVLPTKVHFRVHHEDNKVVSFGVENYDPLTNLVPNVFSINAILGKTIKNEGSTHQVFGGIHHAFNFTDQFFLYHKFLFGFKNSKIKSFLEFGLNNERKQIEGEEKDKPKFETIVHKVVDVKVDADVNDKLKVGLDLNVNFDDKKTETKLYSRYDIERGTAFKARLDNFNTVILGLSHKFGFIDLSFTSRLKFNSGNNDVKAHVKTKFGVALELIDE